MSRLLAGRSITRHDEENNASEDDNELIATSAHRHHDKRFDQDENQDLENEGFGQGDSNNGDSDEQVNVMAKIMKEKSFWIGIVAVIGLIGLSVLLGLVAYQLWTKPEIIPDFNENGERKLNRTVIMVSIDGFRPDYLEMFQQECGNLSEIISNGVKAASMTPIFPSKTFPNHYTLVTGLYAESHGIISNTYVLNF